MEKLVNKEYYLNVPGFLHELHGERSNWRDIGLTHTAAVGITALLIWLSAVAGHPLWMKGLLAFLMYDIAGGVVSNFTRSTNDFYANIRKNDLFFYPCMLSSRQYSHFFSRMMRAGYFL